MKQTINLMDYALNGQLHFENGEAYLLVSDMKEELQVIFEEYTSEILATGLQIEYTFNNEDEKEFLTDFNEYTLVTANVVKEDIERIYFQTEKLENKVE